MPAQNETATHELEVTAERTSGRQLVNYGTQKNRVEVEYALEMGLGHEMTPQGSKHRVRWYGYDAKDGTLEPEGNLPINAVVRYWTRRRIEISL